MTDSHDVIILDVGHANCSIIRSSGAVSVVDAPLKSFLLDALRELGIDTIEAVILSHADKDHIAGVGALLTSKDVNVNRLYVNPDSTKQGATSPWTKLRIMVEVARQENGLKVTNSLTSDSPESIDIGSVSLEVLAPSPGLIMGGAGSTDLDGATPVTSNSASAVVRVVFEGKGMFLLPGDLDGVGLASMLKEGRDASAKVMLFPHHGGLPGDAEPTEFARLICDLVEPELIVFSNSRNLHSNPRPEIVGAILGSCGAGIACTQLSKHCMQHTDGLSQEHLRDLPAHGQSSSSCCAGSLQFNLQELADGDLSCIAPHKDFVADQVISPICGRTAS